MWKFRKALVSALLILAGGCDDYTYHGKTGDQVAARASGMRLEEAYAFYIETYTHTHPPMLDAAEAFIKFGDKGKMYIVNKSLSSQDAIEFEADIRALLIIKYKCDANTHDLLLNRAKKIDANAVAVENLCS